MKMESPENDTDVDMYDVIFKTIYLFLETNDFHQTAESFRAEIRSKFEREVDISTNNARTLILRPYFEESEESSKSAAITYDNKACSTSDSTHVTCERDNVRISEETTQSELEESSSTKKEMITIEYLTQKSPRLQKLDSSRSTCLPNSYNETASLNVNYDSSHNTLKCPDCTAFAQLETDLEYFNKMTLNGTIFNSHRMCILRDSLEMLHNLKSNHQRLINLAQEINNAIWNLSPVSRQLLLAKYPDHIYELYSYPGTHCSAEVVFLLPGKDDKWKYKDGDRLKSFIKYDFEDTEYQVGSSFINSSNESNNLLSVQSPEPYIPLEGKPFIGDIPGLIGKVAEVKEEESVNLIDLCDSSQFKVENMSNHLPKLSSKSSSSNEDSSYLSNDDNERQSPSRFGSDLQVPSKLQDLNKSATLPSVKLQPKKSVSRSKSKSASHLQDYKQSIKQAKTQVNAVSDVSKTEKSTSKTADFKNSGETNIMIDFADLHTSTNSKSNIKDSEQKVIPQKQLNSTKSKQSRYSEVKSVVNARCNPPKLMSSAGNGTKRSKSSPRFVQPIQGGKLIVNYTHSNTSNEEAINYQAMIKEKTKIILEKQKTYLQREHDETSTRKRRQEIDGNLTLFPSFKLEEQVHLVNNNAFSTDNFVKAKPSTVTKNLNWCAIKNSLLEGSPDVKMKLLQALRWRLIDTDDSIRDQILLDYVKNDILSIKSVPPQGQLFLESFYCPKKMATPHALQEEIARFINTLASLSMGRLYLEHDESILSVMLLPLLMGKLPGIKIYDLTREFTMATVQKLSLSNKMRKAIITAGTMEWLISYIDKHHVLMSTYEAEYSTALLTNLSINKEARDRCERVADRVASVVEQLINTPHKCCLNYINPILYSLLLNPAVNEKAVSRGIGMKLKNLYTAYGNDEELKRQLSSIISMHEMHEFCNCDDSETEELNSKNYTDFLEHELLRRDPIYHTPVGEELLQMFYLDEVSNNESPTRPKNVPSHQTTAHILKKNCTCASKSPLMTERPNSQLAAKLNKWQNRPSTTTANNNNSQNLTNKTARNVKAKKVIKSKPGRFLRQRSTSQPPAFRRIPPSPAVNNNIFKREPPKPMKNIKSMHEVRRLDRLERMKMAPLTNQLIANENIQDIQATKFIVNCCYKMDYVNAIAAPPGEYLPQPLHTSSPNLVDIGMLDNADNNSSELVGKESKSKHDCKCFEDMQQFLEVYNKDTGLNDDEETHLVSAKASKTKSVANLIDDSNLNKSLLAKESIDLHPNLKEGSTINVSLENGEYFDLSSSAYNTCSNTYKSHSHGEIASNHSYRSASDKNTSSRSKLQRNSEPRCGLKVATSRSSMRTTGSAILKLLDDPDELSKRTKRT